ncbi:hypothetical protein VTL71DRAFT_4430 [Oculimacula yallundae]|uniref:FAD-dependent oxidoreductase 2 FAD-binding domain-containing protein n=1 Tax=Oculimacula yallundae TaxID=86028 RepID=A0ABR4C348_9HELO
MSVIMKTFFVALLALPAVLATAAPDVVPGQFLVNDFECGCTDGAGKRTAGGCMYIGQQDRKAEWGDAITARQAVGSAVALLDDAWYSPTFINLTTGDKLLHLSNDLLLAHGRRFLRRLASTPRGFNSNSTIQRFDAMAAIGYAEDSNRGQSIYDRCFGDSSFKPNTNLGPLLEFPFFAVQVQPGGLGTKSDLLTDGYARVVREDGSPIRGLYTAGNSSASVM